MSMEELDENMESNAFELSSRMFDLTVDAHLRGESGYVSAYWLDTGENGNPVEEPIVSVGGITGLDNVRRIMERSTTDTDLIAEVGSQYEEKMANMWDDTVEYYEQLNNLAPVMTTLAMDSNTGFMDQAEQQVRDSSEIGVGEEQLFGIARGLACTALVEWSEAVEAPEDSQAQ